VALYDDRLEIISPGELHFGLTPEMLFQPHESKPWNPWIASVFYRRGLIEIWGRGTLKIAALMQEAGLQAPALKDNAGFVTMTFKLPQSRGGVNEGVNEGVSEGVNALVNLISKQPGLRSPAMAEMLHTSTKNIERWLKQLKASQLIEFRGAPKTGGYYPKDS
jgi:ATP-dependent DNA helicase RecG